MITEIQDKSKTITKTKNQNKIVIFNDDVNTFEHVIDCLVIYCDHEPIQAEQCALIIHNNGRCEVKSGDYEDLKPICSFLLEEGLSAQIE